MLLASSRERPGILLNVLECTGESPSPQQSTKSAEVENPCFTLRLPTLPSPPPVLHGPPRYQPCPWRRSESHPFNRTHAFDKGLILPNNELQVTLEYNTKMGFRGITIGTGLTFQAAGNLQPFSQPSSTSLFSNMGGIQATKITSLRYSEGKRSLMITEPGCQGRVNPWLIPNLFK